ncbi:iron-containing alcohol dehydrogenase [Opitutus sp. ER46]|uniref:iron-containing alcohol dehydrogenase n=1 Tax=Opitutus sp. ER46 TaxID=2161864 RepID=UPI000D30C749|nr:iron-containing alcohol dehydrogenase [Opitutus sp. ER46]PTY00337.1 alcohol dehydrogenase [Opitutus sp. ER46]
MIFASSRPLTLLQAGTLTFGPGSSASCGRLLAERGCRRVALVSSPAIAATAEAFAAPLRAAGLEVVPLYSVPAEPDVAALDALRAEVGSSALDAVVGIGGGSALDVAKLLAGMHGRSEPVGRYFGTGLLPARRVVLACVPTTAGTGSEVSPNAILYDPADQLKKAVISPHLVPDIALVDPQLTVTCPPALTAATGIDALVHCLEAYANRFAHPIVDLYALEGIRLIAGNLERAVKQGDDLEARSAVALGSLYGGLCLGPVNTAAVHALAYPLGSEFRLPHGLSNALLLPHVVKYNLPAAPERYAEIARALGVTVSGPAADIAARGVDRLEALCAACNVPTRLSAVGVKAEHIAGLTASALKVTRLLKNNPRELSAADIEQIYRQAL